MLVDLVVSLFIQLIAVSSSVDQLWKGNRLVTDLSQQTCVHKADIENTYYYWRNESEELPYCKKYRKEGMWYTGSFKL